jgi:predicted nucleic acid-binding protein
MRKPKIYLETTLFNFYFDTDRDAHAATVKLFEEIAAGKYEPFTSEAVLVELRKASDEKRDKMVGLISEQEVPVLELNAEAERLADIYVRDGVIPLKYRTDGLHIALAAVNDLDMIISLNFKHIVRKKTVTMTGLVNINLGYKPVEIHTPMEVVDREDT